jgi:hypothetical protein
MKNNDLPDSEIEALISGSATPDGLDGVAALFDELRSIPERELPVGVQLGEFVTPQYSPADTYELVLETTAPGEPSSASQPRKGLLNSAFAQLAVAAAVIVAGVTGAHASGLIDVPGLPDDGGTAELVAAETGDLNDAALASPNTADPSEPETNIDDSAPASEVDPKISFNSGDDGEITANVELGGLSASVRITNIDGAVRVDIDVEGVSSGCEAAIESVHEISDAPEARASIDAAEVACADELALIGPLLGDGDTLAQLLEGLELDLELPERFGNLDELFSGELGQLGDMFGGGFDIENFDPEDLEQLFDDFQFPPGLEEFFDEHPDGGHLDGLFSGELGQLGDMFGGGFDIENFNPEDLEQLFDDLTLPEGFEGLFSDGFDPDQLRADLEELLSGLEADLGLGLEDLLETFGTEINGEDG